MLLPTGFVCQVQLSRLHHRPGGDTPELEADLRRHAEIENAIRDLKYSVGLNHLLSGRFGANGAWLAVQSLPRTRYGVMAHNLARWTSRIGLDEGGDHQEPPAASLFPGRKDHPKGPPTHPASVPALALGNPFHFRSGTGAGHSTARLTPPKETDSPVSQLNDPASSRHSTRESTLTAV